MKQRSGLILLLALFSRVAFGEGSGTFEDALQIAIERSPALSAAQFSQEARSLERWNAYARLLPSLDLGSSLGIGRNSRSSTGVEPWVSTASLTLSEKLWDNGATWLQIKRSTGSRDVSDLQLQKARDQLTLDLLTEWYRFSLAHEVLQVRQEQFRQLTKQFDFVQEQFQQGLRLRKDFLRFRSQVQRAHLNVINAENDIQKSEAEIKRILGIKPDEAEVQKSWVPLKVLEEKIEVPTAAPALTGTYEFRIAELQGNINEWDITEARFNYWPNIYVSGQAQYSNSSFVNNALPFSTNGQVSWNALLTVNWNLLDFGILRRNLAIARKNVSSLEAQLQGTRNSTQAKVRQLMLDLRLLESVHRLNHELLSVEQETYGRMQADYRDGKVSFLDIVTSLNDFLDARVRKANSYFDLKKSLAQYRYFEGRLYQSVSVGTESN